MRLSVMLDGPDKSRVIEAVTAVAGRVREIIAPLATSSPGSSAPVTRWSSDQLRISAQRPWSNDGQQLPFVYSAAIDFEVRFADFSVLNSFYLEVAVLTEVSVEGVTWSLTEPAHLAAVTEVRGLAVHDAQARALTYARALKFEAVVPREIAEPGMLGSGPAPMPGYASDAMMRSAKAGGGPELKPQDIEMTVRVDAKFETA